MDSDPCSLYTQLGPTGNSELLLIYTLTVHRCTRSRVLSLHYPYLDNGFITVSLPLQITQEVIFSESNPFLAISVTADSFEFQAHLPVGWRPETGLFTLLDYFRTAEPLCTYPTENTASAVTEACLPIRCLVMEVNSCARWLSRQCVYRVVA
jgi:hypothetical protein